MQVHESFPRCLPVISAINLLRIEFWHCDPDGSTTQRICHLCSNDRISYDERDRRQKKAAIERSLPFWVYLLQGIYNSFKLKKLVCTIDFDSPAMNPKFIPFILLPNRGVVSLNTNFVVRNFLHLKIQVSVSRILWTTFRFYTKK